MPTTIINGANQAHEKLKLKYALWRPSGDNHFHQFNNVTDFAEEHEGDTVEHERTEKGFTLVDDTQFDRLKVAFGITFNEKEAFVIETLSLGTQGTTESVAATTAPAGTASISNIETGRWHDIGVRGLDTLVVTVDATTLVEGTDFEVDLDAGLIKFFDTADVTDGDTAALTFGNDAIDWEVFTGFNSPRKEGDALLCCFNQINPTQLYDISFAGVCIPVEWPTHAKGGEMGSWKVQLVANDFPTIKRRSA